MRVERVKISGFRSIRNIETDLNLCTAFVGENSSGKSTFLLALNLLLSDTTKFEQLDFHNAIPHDSDNIILQCSLTDITTEESVKLQELYGIPISSLTLRKRGDMNDMRIVTEIDIPKYKNPLLGMDYPSSSTKSEYIDAVDNDELPEYILGEGRRGNIADIRAGLEKYLQEDQTPLEIDGIQTKILKPAELKKLLEIIPEPLYVPAFDDINKQVGYRKNNILGKLLDQIFTKLLENNDLDLKRMDTQITNLTNKFRSGHSSRLPMIADLESSLSSHISDILPDAKALLEFDIPPIEQQMQKYFSISLDDGVRTPVEKKGHGAQRTLTWALLRTYIENISARSSNVIFLVEEPELYLHPQAQRVMKTVLEKLSTSDQVIYSTHSPVFIPMHKPENIRLVRKKQKHTVIDTISDDTINYRKNISRFLTWLDDTRAELFFAKSVVLVEGDTEKILMQEINKERMDGKSLDELGCQILIAGGKFSMPFYCRLLNDLHIPYMVVYDQDSNEKTHRDVNNHIKRAVELSRKSGVLARSHVFYPFLEKDWGFDDDQDSKIERILEVVEDWGTDKPAKYREFCKNVYEFARKAISG